MWGCCQTSSQAGKKGREAGKKEQQVKLVVSKGNKKGSWMIIAPFLVQSVAEADPTFRKGNLIAGCHLME